MKNNYIVKPCHTDGLYLFNVGKARIHAGSNKTKYNTFDMVINLSGYSYQRSIAAGVNGADVICQEFLGYVHHPDDPPELAIDWPDGNVPNLKRKDWRRLVNDLAKFDGDVLVHCYGGHGRTGTLLVILASLSNAIQGDVVKALRDKYCDEICETEKQLDYLKNKIQVKTEAKASRIYIPPVTHSWNDTPYVPPTGATVYVEDKDGNWNPQSWLNYNEEKKGGGKAEPVVYGMYQCIQCQRSKSETLFFQKFQNRTGVCWTCHQAAYLKKYKDQGGELQP